MGISDRTSCARVVGHQHQSGVEEVITQEDTYQAVGCVQNLYVRCYVLDGDAVRIQIICDRD